MIDWSKEIEAVHEDGRVVAMKLRSDITQPVGGLFTSETVELDGITNCWWKPNGKHNYDASRWTIRNRVSTPTPYERAVAPELVEKMRKLVDRMARGVAGDDYSEARAIVAALEPVDEDLAVAREICAEQSIATEHYDDQLSKDLANAFRRGSYDEGREMRIAINSLVRGRQLEKEGK